MNNIFRIQGNIEKPTALYYGNENVEIILADWKEAYKIATDEMGMDKNDPQTLQIIGNLYFGITGYDEYYED